MSRSTVNNTFFYNGFILSFYLLAFSLPLFEAIKQISTAGIIIFGSMYLINNKNVKLEMDLIFWGAALLIIGTILPIITARDSVAAVKGAIDILRIIFVFYVVRYVWIKDKVIINFFLILFGSFTVAFLLGEYRLLTNINRYLELNSIGHVNHSAIYMGIIAMISYGMLKYKGGDDFTMGIVNRKNLQKISFFVLILSITSLLIAGSRAAWIGTFIPLLFSIFIWFDWKSPKTWFVVGSFTILSVLVIMSQDYALRKFHEGISYDSGRFLIWKSSLMLFFDENLYLGIGSKNFHFLPMNLYFPDSPIQHISHAHNTFLTFLIEKGILGLIGYLVFLLGIFINLTKKSKREYLRIIAINTFFLNLIISTVNTTFHDENALLMVILWSLSLQSKKSQKIVNCYNNV